MLLLVSACSVQPPLAPVDGVQSRHWTLEGKLSFRYNGQTRVAAISWQQQQDVGDITLTAAFGLGQVHLLVDGNEITVSTDEGEQVLQASEAVHVDGASYRLPWDRLSWWVRGLEGPGGNPLGSAHREGGWEIRILRRDTLGPVLMEFVHPEVSLRLKVHEWRFAPRGTVNKVI